MRVFKKPLRVLLYVILIGAGALMLLPFIWTLSSSFKFDREIFEYPIRFIPKAFRISNYIEVWSRIPLLTYFLNSLRASVTVVVLQSLICSMSAYAFSKLRFPGREPLFLLYIATMMVPWHAIMIPQFIIVKNLGLYNHLEAIIVLQLFSAFGVFLMRQFMMGIPIELTEAARIDGCNEFTIFWKIVLPNAKPGLATLAIFTFTHMWNDYMAPMLYLNDDKVKTLQIGLASFTTNYGMEYGITMAGVVCALLPMVILYCFAQKYMIEGVAFSGMKG